MIQLVERKRRIGIESDLRGIIGDVLVLSGQGVSMCGCGQVNSDMWKGMFGGAVWTGLYEIYKGRSKAGCAI